MDVTLQKHHAKHVYKVPEGLRELCTDISREVLRSQPANLIAFIAEYVDTLLITRENTKIAVKVVNNILLGSQAILCILYQSGFTLEQITVAAPKIQKAFQEYLDAVDTRPVQICEDTTCDEQSMISIRSILEATGATREDAERAATVIQAAFRGHYERMVLNEAHGKIQWQRAVMNTLDILRKAGATQAEISKAARHVKSTWISDILEDLVILIFPAEAEEEPLKKDERILEPAEAIQAVAWMEMMYEDSGLTLEKANEAASVIQRAYKRYRTRRRCYDVQQLETTKSMVAEAVLDEVRHKIFEKVTSRKDIPEEYGTREEMMAESTKLQVAFKEHLKVSLIVQEGVTFEDTEKAEEEEEEEEGEEEEEEDEGIEKVEPPSKPKYRPAVLTDEESTEEEEEEEEEEGEAEELQVSEIEITTATSPELLSERETDQRLTDAEIEEEAEKAEPEEEREKEEKEEKEEQEELKEETKEDEKKEQKEVETEEEKEEKRETEEGPSDVEETDVTAHHAAE